MDVTLSGKVIHGDRYGKRLGFPTANLDRRSFSRRKLKIKIGVYAGAVFLPLRPKRSKAEKSILIKNRPLDSARGGTLYSAAIVIGPLDISGLPKIEAHLIGFKGNLYGKHLEIYLNRYLRPFKKFKNSQKLIAQIKKDINKINLISNCPN